MSEVRETRKTKNIAFRVTDEEFAQIERIALAMGEDPNNWCRNITVTEAREGSGLTKTDRLLYEEIAWMRYIRAVQLQRKVRPEQVVHKLATQEERPPLQAAVSF